MLVDHPGFRVFFGLSLLALLPPFILTGLLGWSHPLSFLAVIFFPLVSSAWIHRRFRDAVHTLQGEQTKKWRRELERLQGECQERDGVLRGMAEGIVAVDDKERVILINRAAAEILGVDQVRAMGKPMIEAVPNIDLIRCLEAVLQGGQEADTELVLKDDGEKQVKIRGLSLRAADGKQLGAFLVLGDVTRLRQLEGMRSDFVSNVSHEIKTPLTSIKGFVETLLESVDGLPEEAKTYLEIIQKQSDRLDEIVNDLLMLSRLETGAGADRMEMGKHCLGDVIHSAVAICQSKWHRDKVFTVNVSAAVNLVLVMNPRLMEEVFVNLIDNAIKYGKSGVCIEVVAQSTNAVVSVSVKDDGPGIAREYLGRLFERFYRVDAARTRAQGGSGLGLSIVKHIVQVHGGEISVESELGRGTTFRMNFPVNQE